MRWLLCAVLVTTASSAYADEPAPTEPAAAGKTPTEPAQSEASAGDPPTESAHSVAAAGDTPTETMAAGDTPTDAAAGEAPTAIRATCATPTTIATAGEPPTDIAAAGEPASGEAPAAGETPAESGRPTEKGALGLGLIFGEPTGIAAKLYLRDDQAIQAAVGAAFAASGYQVHADYVFHPWILQDRDTFVLPVYLGPGARVIDYAERGSNSHVAVGLRAVVGILFDFKNVPLDVFVEVAGIGEYDFTDGWGLGLNVGAGVRYYF